MRNVTVCVFLTLLLYVFGTARVYADYPDLDYLGSVPSEYAYDLKFGHKMGYSACRLTVSVEKRPKDPNSEGSRNLLDLTLSYADFHCSYEDKEHEKTVKSELQAAGIDVFTFRATIDKCGNVVWSNLAQKMKGLEEKGASQRRFSAVRLGPMIGCTWTCVFPRLSAVDGDELIQYDTRDWEALGAELIVVALKDMNTGARLKIRRHEFDFRKSVAVYLLWAETSKKTMLKKYGGDRDISETTRVEYLYDYTRKVITKGMVEVETTFSDEEGTNPAFLEAKMR